jgi:hypothetical protein
LVDDRLSDSRNGLFPLCRAHHAPRLVGL